MCGRRRNPGGCPNTLSTEGAIATHDPAAGGIYYWPQSEVIAIYYADLGQSVPGTGLVRLGVINPGLERLANAGKEITVRIGPAAETGP